MKVVKKNIPVQFEQVSQLDGRFQKVKIWLMHLGRNYNNSIFQKEVVEEAIDSLKNTPILGYIEESRIGDKDFRGHEVELVVEGGELKQRYIGQAFGVIPENCNPRWEQKTGDSGQILDYLVVDGLMWNKFDDAIDILNSHGEVAQSMELHDDYDGYWDDEGYFVFTNFSFYGACLLGQDVLPAMQGASVETAFSINVDVYQEVIAKKLEEYQLAFSAKTKEVEQEMTLEELLEKFSTSVEALAEKGVDVNEYSIEDLEVKLKEVFDTDETITEPEDQKDEGGDDKSDDEETEFEQTDEDADKGSEQEFNVNKELESEGENDVEKYTRYFELSHEDIRRKMYNSIDSHMEASGIGGWHYIVSVYETHFITESGDGEVFYKVAYEKNGNSIVLGDVSQVYPMFLTSDEKGALELMRSNYEQIEQENAKLKEFQSTILKAQHEEKAEDLFAKFSKLSADEVADIRENLHDYTLEDIESRLFERLGRKMANFSTEAKKSSIKMKIAQDELQNISGYDHIFKKHGFA